ncbi:MAG: SlyX family protein [Pseudohongiella sp.]
MSTDTTLVDLQTRFAFQEDSLQALNEIVTRQQQQIETLTRELGLHREKLAELLEAQSESMVQSGVAEDRPPHY